MRVLWLVRAGLERHTGGDTVQILETARALRTLGVELELSSDARPALAGCDLVHLFHLDRLWENLPHAERAHARGLPVALSTIWWPASEFDARGRRGLQGRIARLVGPRRYPSARLLQRSAAAFAASFGRRPRRPMLHFQRAARRLLERAGVLLPNSRAELDALRTAFGLERPAELVPNAADASFFRPPPFATPRPDGVACVGRIEPRKNQLALIEALAGSGIALTLVGRAGRFSAAYERACRRAAGPEVSFRGQLGRDELRALLRTTAVHAAPSWYETPGLASIEAALCGARLVVTPGGSTREYFGEHAFTCRPDDPPSILAAVRAALSAGETPALAARLSRECTWEVAARATLRGYERALGCAAAPMDTRRSSGRESAPATGAR